MKLDQRPVRLPTENNGCLVTNSSGSSVVVLNSFNDSNQVSTVFENKLTQLFPKDSTKILLDKESKEIILIGNFFTSNGEKIPGNIYDLLLVSSTTSFPVDNSVVIRSNGSYPSLPITKEQKDRMLLAFRFCQNILAYPTSNLALDYTKTCKGILNGKASSKNAINSITIDFFQKTKLYKTLTLVEVTTVMSYINNFVSPWVGSGVYYLYSSATGTTNVTQAKAPNFIGTLTFTKNSSDFDPTDRKNGYTINLEEGEGKITSVEYKQGIFYADADAIISLKPSFLTKSRLTNKPQDNNIILTLNGEVNGVSVFGVQTKQELSAQPGSDSSWYAFWHPKNFKQWMSLSMTLMGLLMGVHMMGSLVSWIYKKVSKQFTPSSEMEKILQDTNQEIKRLRTEMQQIQDKLGEGKIPDPAEIEESIGEARAGLTAQTQYQKALGQTDILKEQNKILDEYAEITGVNEQIESSSYKIQSTMDSTEQALNQFSDAKTPQEITEATDQLGDVVSANAETLPSIKEALTAFENQIASDLSSQSQANIEESNKVIEELEEAQETAQKNSEETEDGEGGDTEDVEDFDFDFFMG